MASSEKEKHHANSRARRNSSAVVVHQSKKKRSKKDKDKDTDTESISSSTNSTDTVVAEPRKCPLRFMLDGLSELGEEVDGSRPKGCPLRRVQLWHTIPLCLLAVINLLLVIIALLGLAGYRIVMGIQSAVFHVATPESPYAASAVGTDDGTLVTSTV